MPDTLPDVLQATSMSDSKLEKLKHRDGRVQLGTLGRGNHFVEFQADHEGCLWLMVHSGSRAMGQAISSAVVETLKEIPMISHRAASPLKSSESASTVLSHNGMVVSLATFLLRDCECQVRHHRNSYRRVAVWVAEGTNSCSPCMR